MGCLESAAAIAGHLNGDPIGALCLGSAGLTSGIVWWRSTQHDALVSHSNLLVGSLYFSICALSLFGGGGLSAPALYALPALPALAALTAGRRSALYWMGCCLLTTFAMFAYGEEATLTRFPLEAFGPLRIVALCSTTLFVLFAMLDFESRVRHRNRELEAAKELALRAHLEAEAARVEAEAANQAKSTFLATMSHEFRTPLTALLGISELLRERLEPADRLHLDLLEVSSKTLNTLIDDILDLAKIESNTLRMESVPVDLKRLVSEVAGMLQRNPSAAALHLSYRQEGPRFVIGDPVRLRQILVNLGGNALKFTNAGEVDIRCVSQPLASDRVGIQLTVRDTGIGIATEDQEAIFGRFAQVETSRDRPSRGVGLGLRIVRELVTMMGGTVSLDSALGRGSTFTVDLELSAADAPSPTPTIVPKDVAMRVLLAEDEPVNQTVIRLMLERMGCTVEVASNGEDAIEAAIRGDANFDLVLMDCRMPILGGIEATRDLRARNITIPIVALTANAADQDRDLCLEAGMNDFVPKPLTLPTLGRLLLRAKNGELSSRA
jgi:signal transduction histidine kinase/CheY-like chemotaxis protein